MVSQEGKVANMERDVKGRLCPHGIGAEPPQHHGRVTWECCSWGMGTSAGTSVVWLCRGSVQSEGADSQQVLAGTHKLEIGMCLDLHGGLRCPWILSPRAGEEELPGVSCSFPKENWMLLQAWADRGIEIQPPGQVEAWRNHMEN